MTEEQLLLSGLLRDMLRSDFTELIVSLAGRSPLHIDQEPRLVWVIEGTAPIQIGGPQGIGFRHCRAGSVICVYPGAPSGILMGEIREPSRTLAIRFLPDTIRVATYQFNSRSDWRHLMSVYHLPSPLPRLGQTMLSLVLRMAADPRLAGCAGYQIKALLQLVSDLLTRYAGAAKEPGKAEYLWRQIAAHLDSRLQEPLSRRRVAAEFKLNESYLCSLCKRHTGFSFNTYTRELRLARTLLMLEMNLSLDEISESCGFHSTNYFIRCFKRKYGSTPAKYRRIPLPELT